MLLRTLAMLTCALPQPLPRSVSGHSYVPQTYFYAPREETPLPIHGTSDSSPHFLHDESTLLWGLEKMIEVTMMRGKQCNLQAQTRPLVFWLSDV